MSFKEASGGSDAFQKHSSGFRGDPGSSREILGGLGGVQTRVSGFFMKIHRFQVDIGGFRGVLGHFIDFWASQAVN